MDKCPMDSKAKKGHSAHHHVLVLPAFNSPRLHQKPHGGNKKLLSLLKQVA